MPEHGLPKYLSRGGSASCQAGFNVVGMGSTQYNFSNNSTATNLPPISTVSYLWTFGDGDTATTTNAMHSYAQPGNYTVCLYQTVRDSSNQVSCTSDTCLIINVPPQVTCQAEFTFVKDSSASRTINFLEQSNLGNLPPGAQVTQFWNFGDGASDTGTAVTHHYSNAGNYIACLSIIVLDSLNGDTLCQSTLCKAINISPVPVFCQVQYIVDTANSYFGSVYIWNTSNPVQSDSSYTNSYTWDFGDGNKSNQAFPVHAFNNPGLYQVCLSILSINQVGDTCMSTYCDSLGADSLGNLIYKNSQTAFKLTVLNPENISLRENELKKTRLFPNPATNQVRVVLPTQLAKVEWQLLDLKGSVVKYGSTRNCQLLNLDVALLPPGIYLLSLNSEALTPDFTTSC
ncbi:MAG: PKD domain-containing protein [Owenweeksia sp.]|nr:PKD domain-containing protein [Owenweeksia sp.]